jgi:hypothetical protein
MRAVTLPVFGLLALLAGCGNSAPPPAAPAPSSSASTMPTRVTAFAVSNDNLRVDKVGSQDGQLNPDGSPDLVFTATTEGPIRAIFVYECDAQGNPAAGLRADTVIGTKDVPPELGSVVDQGKMTLGVGVFENGKVLNEPTGTVHIDGGVHQLTLYVSDDSTLKAGDFVRIWVRAGGQTIAGPVAQY